MQDIYYENSLVSQVASRCKRLSLRNEDFAPTLTHDSTISHDFLDLEKNTKKGINKPTHTRTHTDIFKDPLVNHTRQKSAKSGLLLSLYPLSLNYSRRRALMTVGGSVSMTICNAIHRLKVLCPCCVQNVLMLGISDTQS